MQADQVAPLDRPAAAVANDPSPAPHNPAQVAPAPNRPGAYPAERQAAVQTRPQPGCEPTNRCFCIPCCCCPCGLPTGMLCFGWVNTIAGVLGTILLIVFDAKSPGGQSPASAVVQLLPYLEMIVFGAACLTAVYKKSSRAGFITIILSGLQIVLNLVVSLVVSTMLPVALVQLAVNVYYWYVMWSYYQKLLDRDWAIAHNIPLDQVSPV